MIKNNSKIALVYDGLFCRGGGERVLLNFQEAFPEAPIYTTMYNASDTYPELRESKINATWFSKIAKNEKEYKQRFFPLAIIAMRQVDLRDYDIILMATTHCSKYVKFSPNAKVFAYTFTPFRLAWNPNSYSLYADSKGLFKMVLKILVTFLRHIDYYYSIKIPNYLAMTEETKQRLIDAYHPQNLIPVLNPPIDVNDYFVSDTIDDYYLVVSRLEKYKKVDLVIETFNQLGKPLIIVGRGVEKDRLKAMAKPNIIFKEGLSNAELANIYSKARALIFPQHEDYGLTPLESAASGRPVIAYGYGGVLDTMIPYNGSNEDLSTALFFFDQTIESLTEAVDRFETLKFDSGFIRKHSEKYHKDEFIKNIKEIVLKN